tara:strand:+ start:2082 stop:2546 length:465 start_codon:yes stop_codon:yes gene_type:complete
MLIKQFLNDKEHQELLNWAIALDFYHKANGKDVFTYYLEKSYLPLLNNIITKVSEIYNQNYIKHKINYKESCFVRINPKGWINVHTDTNDKEVKNFNILLKKPQDGGFILHGDTKVIMQEKDAYLLDATIPHGISSIKSDDYYYSILLYYGIIE